MSLSGVSHAETNVYINRLTFSFGTKVVFHNFSFVTRQRVTILRGPSGCGKTTLLKLIYGLLEPDHVHKLLRPKCPFLILQSDNLVPWFSGRQNITEFSTDLWRRVQASPLFALIEPFVNQRAADMSFGQRRSVELVRALCAQPGILLLDEPFNFLDKDKRNIFLRDIIDGDAYTSNRRVIMTTHYTEDIIIPDAEIFEFHGDMPHQSLLETSS
jgi:ABC-type nitrate/sulfonate/bicarbonate transport system ATPase subunit